MPGMTLDELIDFASNFAENRMQRVGELGPMWHAITAAGAHVILTAPHAKDKEHAVEIIRAEFEKLGVVRYVFLSEAWMRFSKPDEPIEEALMRGAANHLERVEIVMFSAEDRDEGQKSARREIKRASDGTVTLGPLEHDPDAGGWMGRMVGMLGPRQTKTKSTRER